MQLKVFSTLVFASLAAAIAVPPADYNGNPISPPPTSPTGKIPLPLPTSSLLPPPKEPTPDGKPPVPHLANDSANDPLPRADGDIPQAPKKDLPPPNSFPPTATPTDIPPHPTDSLLPPPKDFTPTSTPLVPHPAKDGANAPLPRADGDIPQAPKKDFPPPNTLPPSATPTDIPPHPTDSLLPPPPKDLPLTSALPVPHSANDNTSPPGGQGNGNNSKN